jgi:hypothetical protein
MLNADLKVRTTRARLPDHLDPSGLPELIAPNTFSGVTSLCPKKYWRALRSPTFVSRSFEQTKVL